ncbi:MAG: hypothetical protein JWR07_1918 [Nevskia sp.]|nr:hypothetical protein [Nevskia sp.]
MNDPDNSPPTSQTEGGGGDEPGDEWLQLAQHAYRSSTSYVDTNYRKTWEDSIRAFHSQHASDSKYTSASYEKRSRLFRPKTRSVIRKNEAAGAAAFFSNLDTTTVSAVDQSNKLEQASAEIMKELLQYRLTRSIPWFQVVLGGLQDAQTVGVVCSHNYWKFKGGKAPPQAPGGDVPMQMEQAEQPAEAEAKPLIDKPCVDLIPAENLRIDAGADWTDPINSSPYVIHLMPMYVMDVKQRMIDGDWEPMDDGAIRNAIQGRGDTTRAARNKDRQDPYEGDNKSVMDYEVVWVQRHIHRKDGEDWEFYTLADHAMLTEARPLSESVFHGERPYVMGCCIIETHKIYPAGLPVLGKGLQDEANEVVNQRMDNVKLVLNKKWFVKRGRDADIGGLVRNVPGGVVMLEDPEKDVREITWPDVTASAYEEQSRIDTDMNDLLGNFSPAQVMADHGINGPARNMALLGQSAGTLVEYLLRTYVETFVQPVLRQLVKLEQHYETDEVILAIAAKKAKLFQKFGMDTVTDEMLNQELTLTVNVGMGATDPQMRLQKFISATSSIVGIMEKKIIGINMQEIAKEIYGMVGYQDGSRFFTNDNPQVAQLTQQLQQAMQMIQQLNQKVQEKQTAHQVKLAATKMTTEARSMDTRVKEDGLNSRAVVTHLRAIEEHRSDQTHAHAMANRAPTPMAMQ